MSDVTRILNAIERGDAKATDELLPVVYEELRLLAAQKLAQERPGQTLQPTALVHEAYLRLVIAETQDWSNRGHFFAAAAEAMRRILVERAHKKQRIKRGGAHQRVYIEEDALADEEQPEILLVLDEALDRFAREDPVRAELVKLRYFAGLTLPEAAKALNISKATADRYWSYARAWLFHEINQA
jgi:RNA polymerase sigma factor (TIGR02999 family)